jgi:NAD(P)-dependent dehydrogenase (short-subunit alcohol dehydrogenase family)
MASNTAFEFPPYTRTIHRSSYPAIEPTNPANSAKGKVVVVTGGNQGVGKGIAKAFVQAGAKAVVILSRRGDVLSQAKAELEAINTSTTKVLTFKADILDKAALDAAFESTEKDVGKIDVLVANAAYFPAASPAETADVDDWFKGFEVNLKGTLLTFKAFMKHRSKHPIFISLTSGVVHVQPFPGNSSYAASKLGQASLIQYLQAENPDMVIHNMHPGVIESEMNTKSQMPLSKDNVNLPSAFAVWLATPAASWLGGKLVWCHWDVDQLAEMKENIIKNGELTIGLSGWPKLVDAVVVA